MGGLDGEGGLGGFVHRLRSGKGWERGRGDHLHLWGKVAGWVGWRGGRGSEEGKHVAGKGIARYVRATRSKGIRAARRKSRGEKIALRGGNRGRGNMPLLGSEA